MNRLPFLSYLWAPVLIAVITSDPMFLAVLWVLQAVIGSIIIGKVTLRSHDG